MTKKSYNLTPQPYAKLKEGPEVITENPQWSYMENLEKANELLKANNSDRKKLIDEILTAIQDKEVITGDRLEDWGQCEYGIEHRTGPKG